MRSALLFENVVKFIGFNIERQILVTEYVNGEKWQDAAQFLDKDAVVRVSKTLAYALNFMVFHDWLHRDLHPGNIRFREPKGEGGPLEPVLLDYGLLQSTSTSPSKLNEKRSVAQFAAMILTSTTNFHDWFYTIMRSAADMRVESFEHLLFLIETENEALANDVVDFEVCPDTLATAVWRSRLPQSRTIQQESAFFRSLAAAALYKACSNGSRCENFAFICAALFQTRRISHSESIYAMNESLRKVPQGEFTPLASVLVWRSLQRTMLQPELLRQCLAAAVAQFLPELGPQGIQPLQSGDLTALGHGLPKAALSILPYLVKSGAFNRLGDLGNVDKLKEHLYRIEDDFSIVSQLLADMFTPLGWMNHEAIGFAFALFSAYFRAIPGKSQADVDQVGATLICSVASLLVSQHPGAVTPSQPAEGHIKVDLLGDPFSFSKLLAAFHSDGLAQDILALLVDAHRYPTLHRVQMSQLRNVPRVAATLPPHVALCVVERLSDIVLNNSYCMDIRRRALLAVCETRLKHISEIQSCTNFTSEQLKELLVPLGKESAWIAGCANETLPVYSMGTYQRSTEPNYNGVTQTRIAEVSLREIYLQCIITGLQVCLALEPFEGIISPAPSSPVKSSSSILQPRWNAFAIRRDVVAASVNFSLHFHLPTLLALLTKKPMVSLLGFMTIPHFTREDKDGSSEYRGKLNPNPLIPKEFEEIRLTLNWARGCKFGEMSALITGGELINFSDFLALQSVFDCKVQEIELSLLPSWELVLQLSVHAPPHIPAPISPISIDEELLKLKYVRTELFHHRLKPILFAFRDGHFGPSFPSAEELAFLDRACTTYGLSEQSLLPFLQLCRGMTAKCGRVLWILDEFSAVSLLRLRSRGSPPNPKSIVLYLDILTYLKDPKQEISVVEMSFHPESPSAVTRASFSLTELPLYFKNRADITLVQRQNPALQRLKAIFGEEETSQIPLDSRINSLSDKYEDDDDYLAAVFRTFLASNEDSSASSPSSSSSSMS
eukprot:TRINITY_DN2181_c0_g2_i1.p1 TRINITY_DN2181_c0_g2~~TRINITY_DN2181_c0_g2_i1.p1  ORF type:complete len:1008 (+),score=111.83 TRINITY_DN2181_c0_g2_i1:515-3538(+)